MEIRKVRPEEYQRTDEIYSLSFGFKIEQEQPTAGEDARYAAFEDGKMISVVYRPDYGFNFDGHTVKMAGIGGVSTLPPYRRKGAIRGIMNLLLKDSFKEGFLFSYLFPFSTSYYRQYGYETACDVTSYDINTNALPTGNDTDRCFLLEENREEGLKYIKAAYEYTKEKYNAMVSATEDTFKWATEESALKEAVYTYIYPGKESFGFITYELRRDGGLHVSVPRLMYKGEEALYNLLGLVKSYASDYPRTIVRRPMTDRLERVVKEWSFGNLRRESIFHGMVRVVNVKEVLLAARYKGDGELKIHVEDSILPENNKTFHVRYAGGKALSVEETLEKEDISMPINEFSARILGYDNSLGEINRDVCGKIEAENIFYQKPVYIVEEF